MIREERLVRAFVELTDTLVADFDVLDFLHGLCEKCVDVLDVEAAGVLLADEGHELRLVSASSERMRVVEAFEAQHHEGPCVDAYRGVERVLAEDLAKARARWPVFVPKALDAGFGSAAGFPLRLRAQCIGALDLLLTAPGTLSGPDLVVAQALADVATVAVLQERALREARELSGQLQHALASRVVIEQAKGIVSKALGVDMEEAFARLRRYSQDWNLALSDVAERVVGRALAPENLPGARQ